MSEIKRQAWQLWEKNSPLRQDLARTEGRWLNPVENKAGDKQHNLATGSVKAMSREIMLKLKDCSRIGISQKERMLDPGGNVVLTWSRVFLVSCVASHFIDPLFFFLPIVKGRDSQLCMTMDYHLAIILTCLRSFLDMFFIVHIAIRFSTAYVDPGSKVLGKGELVTDPKRIAKRYIRRDFFIDLVAALPVPQFLVWAVMPYMSFKHINAPFFLIILVQSAIRLYTVILLSINILEMVGFIAKNGWEGAIYNLVLYLVASHVVGAIFYLTAVDRQKTCWETQCSIEDSMAHHVPCDLKFLDCKYAISSDSQSWANSTNVFTGCNANSNNVNINYGIFIRAIQNGVTTTSFSEKYFYSLWWGLQQLTTYGNPLVTSSFIGENLFAIGLTLLSIGLFAQLIGNMQIQMRSLSKNTEDWRIWQAEMEDWMTDHQIPDELRYRISQFLKYKWIATQGVEENSVLRQLPADLHRDIKRYLCLDLIERVPFFSAMDQQLLDAICERMTYFLSTEGTYIIREGDPVKVMLFIIRGELESSTTDGGRTDFFNSIILKPGDFCGEELLTWALLPSSRDSYPSSTRTVKTIAELEAFSLQADDIKCVANTFRMMHSKHLQHTFRLHSYQWRTWAARFIQSAWRRHQNRQKMAEVGLSNRWESFFSLVNDFNEMRCDDANGSSSTVSKEATVTVSKIASIFKKAQKERPEEPDFSADHHLE
ncbi:protein CNGC15b-like isoform X1 [Oryza brachyantha]|uniref:protein CNGC15b-like isoform X1 n=1 Tax=Oryza brachyantha TaxID=4533 RepID=UPI0007765133|nr:protein CNGC15b-like isoform X1 [Oryza brachyantha]